MIPSKILTLLPILAYITLPFTPADMRAAQPNSGYTRICSYSYNVTTVLSNDDVDVPPSFPGGDFERINFINATRRYPADDYNNKVQGRVVCSFIVNADGSISDATILRGVTRSLNEEALRIINAMPNWEAGRLDGKCVPVYQVMSISFRL
ncbi:MAG: energy transducer TonB [Muribaculaceae bacterium]|nr:energy transducer TonB [Muribaculaceae bacterium]